MRVGVTSYRSGSLEVISDCFITGLDLIAPVPSLKAPYGEVRARFILEVIHEDVVQGGAGDAAKNGRRLR